MRFKPAPVFPAFAEPPKKSRSAVIPSEGEGCDVISAAGGTAREITERSYPERRRGMRRNSGGRRDRPGNHGARLSRAKARVHDRIPATCGRRGRAEPASRSYSESCERAAASPAAQAAGSAFRMRPTSSCASAHSTGENSRASAICRTARSSAATVFPNSYICAPEAEAKSILPKAPTHGAHDVRN